MSDLDRGPVRRLRILSWNICELRGDLSALVEAVRDLDPDVFLVQEAPRLVLPQTRLDWFARRIDRRILVGGRFGRGLAILGTDEVARQVIRRGMHKVRQVITDGKSTYPRGVAAVRLSVGDGQELLVSCIHFALQEDNRLTHARHVVELIEGAGAPVVIGGDLNEVATGPARSLLAEVSRDPAEPAQWTFPASGPTRRIDALYATPGVRVLDARRVTETEHVPADRFSAASDHLPTLLDIEVPAF
ncbi:endonuclease/exonuclease/phosphatase family protein [Brachybacterium sp. AOP25-B2-12]|uniref:endonuclease/exonuclease/phosphatase family protein n=1 Tax=Brachybacterium sp. AOP25-B2-12 TaxID=3457710 RepID=UPI0040345BAB